MRVIARIRVSNRKHCVIALAILQIHRSITSVAHNLHCHFKVKRLELASDMLLFHCSANTELPYLILLMSARCLMVTAAVLTYSSSTCSSELASCSRPMSTCGQMLLWAVHMTFGTGTHTVSSPRTACTL